MKRILLLDLDNTVYDWVFYFANSINAMVTAASELTQIPVETIFADIRFVNQKYHNSEHPFALLEALSIKNWLDSNKLDRFALNDAFYAFNKSRKNNLTLYPRVKETLDVLKTRGFTIIAYTDSNLFSVIDRCSRLSLTDYIDFYVCVEESSNPHPNIVPMQKIFEKFDYSRVLKIKPSERKPNPDVINRIVMDFAAKKIDTYVCGDSLKRDIFAARKSNLFSIWASYGNKYDQSLYEIVKKVSHWTDLDIQNEHFLEYEARGIEPDATCINGFAEIAEILN
jgi:FMN phosphatase YigB (HAD superfamily)